MSIKRKLLATGVALALVPMAVVGWYAYHMSSGTIRDMGYEQVTKVADLAGKQLDEAIMNHMDLIRQVSLADAVLKAGDALAEKSVEDAKPELDAVGKVLSRFMNAVGQDFETILLAGKGGVSLVDGRGEKFAGIDLSKRAYFKTIMDGADVSIQTAVSKTTGQPITILGVPVKNSKGMLVGMVAGMLKLESWTEKILGITMGRTGFVFVMEKDGLVVMHPETDRIMKSNMAEEEGMKDPYRKITGSEAGTIAYTIEGEPKIAGFATIPITGWKVVATQDLDDFLALVYRIRMGVILAGIIFGLLALAGALAFSRGISKPLARAVQVADSVALGDLTQRLDYRSKNEIGALARSLNAMTDALEKKAILAEAIADGDLTREMELASDRDGLGRALEKMTANLSAIIAQIQDSVRQVANESGQVSDSSQALSQGATEQAASLEEITSSLTQIGAQTNTNSENANQANKLSETVRRAADNGNARMAEMVGAMQEINGASREIANIIKTIDDIAFQTNLLALNAAVESARAGVHGKGFAVVAQEVRNLAGRSAKAAKETEELIASTVRKVQAGTEIADRTAEALGQIRSGVSQMADLTGEISTASREQAAGIGQINAGLLQIEQVTQQNTANAEETASAAHVVSSQAELLRKTILARFKLRQRAGGAFMAGGDRSTPARIPGAGPGRKQLAGIAGQAMGPEDVAAWDGEKLEEF